MKYFITLPSLYKLLIHSFSIVAVFKVNVLIRSTLFLLAVIYFNNSLGLISNLLKKIAEEDKKQKIITWEDSVKLPWGIILLFGGGLSVAAAMQESGLALWFGEKAYLLNDLSVIFIILLIVPEDLVEILEEVKF